MSVKILLLVLGAFGLGVLVGARQWVALLLLAAGFVAWCWLRPPPNRPLIPR